MRLVPITAVTARAIFVPIVLVVLPRMPLFMALRRFLHNESDEPTSAVSRARIQLSIITASFLLLLCGLFWSSVLRPDYSRRRFTTIHANLAIVILAFLASAFGSRRFKAPLLAAGAIVAVGWAYAAVVNSVV